ncbi:L-lactate permease [Mycobacterium sp. 1274761.0]|uniref:L-lactate permease n=1 Tax=Mycobacterium sp. 1274761.0 TaxID=1834077 RepID=UPI0007FC4C3E|nr:L-lactate permease [Mycobacterium sp. 1274761.0]OBK75507.1 hypothetical protein A5651_07520 [Mycobacterium sp. 1274761.0]
MYQQVLDPVGHSLAWSSLVAAIPLLLLFVLLGVVRVTAWVASLISLAVAIAVAVLVYGMPQNLAIAAAAVGMNGKEGDIFRRVVIRCLGNS